ncbi:MAG: hypothetical protein Q9227_009234 [Pyrenula ochraceoflavens]
MPPSTLPLNEIPTLSLLYKLKHLKAPSTTPQFAPNQQLNSKISLIRHDLTKLRVDAIVNAANTSLLGGGGVDGAIHRAAGPELVEECSTLDGCNTGSAKITNAYQLPCSKVIHAVGPVYNNEKESGPSLRGCYRKSLELAVENGCKSIAFSAISTGIYGYPSIKAAEAAISEVREYLTKKDDAKKLDRVIFCSFEMKDVDAYNEVIPKYFPPTEADLPSESRALEEGNREASESLTADLPDAPTTQPRDPDEPDAKKLKIDSEAIDEGWEEINPSTATAENGPPTEKQQLQTDDPTQKVEAAYEQGVISPDPAKAQPTNILRKDW